MKKYILKILAFIMCVAAPFVIYAGYVFSTADTRSGTIAATLRYKTHLLHNSSSPKIICTGGSSSPYGVNCQQIADGTGTDCICIGATAYLGKGIYLNMLEKEANPGDTVILGFETFLLNDETINYVLVWEAAGNDFLVWKSIPHYYYEGMFCSFIDYANLRIDTKNVEIRDYHSDFGPLGDVITYREAVLESGYNTQDMHSLDQYAVNDKELEKIKNFSSKMAKKGVKVYFAYAPLDKLCITSTEEEIHQYAQYIEDYLNIPVVVSIDDAIMEGKYFYNTNNHLTTEGASIYSDCVIRGINSLQ